ncbi:MAG: glutamate formimidoyltransferase [Anaerolineales bacterium]
MKPLVECVPNFSAGRDQETVDAIVEAIRGGGEVHVLDVSSDPDHNRTVVTFVGAPVAVQEAAFRGIAKAAELIDLDEHRGEHPRLGAADVVPFIPLQGVLTQECVALAHDLGRRVGEELRLPVYFYGEAALRPDRERLEDVRRGEYEQLKAEIETNPDRRPDAGPARVGKAGAVIIGARQFLIAFNAYLDSDDVSIARRIARAVRHSGGGYRYVKALGVLAAGQAQVSMNLTDYRRTPIYHAVEAIRREAARYGTRVTHTELVGLIPQEALVDTARWYLQLELFAPQQILERRLTTLDEGAPLGYLETLAAKEPTPAGGSAAALAGALGAALAAMVGRLTAGRRRFADVQEEVRDLIVEAEKLRAALAARMEEDSAAYDAVMAAYKRPQGTGEQQRARNEALQKALERAGEVPLATARDALRVLELALVVTEKGNPNAVTDAATGAWLAWAAVQSAALAVRANAARLQDEARAETWRQELGSIVEHAESLVAQAQDVAVRRAQL